jgi:hypothetical protein
MSLVPIFLISYFSCCCDKIPEINNIKERKGDFSSLFQRVQFIKVEKVWPSSSVHIMAPRKQRKSRGLGTQYNL